MKIDWTMMLIAIGIFTISCFFPYFGIKAQSKLIRGYWAVGDAILTIIATLIAILAFANRWWGAIIVLFIMFTGGSVFEKVVGKNMSTWYKAEPDVPSVQDPGTNENP